MFDVGFWEMAFIGVIALVIIGPERLPGVARTVGLWVGKARRMINEVKSDVKREMKEYDMDQVKAFKSELDEASKNLKDVTKSTTESLGLKEAADDFKNSVEGVSDSLKKETSALNQSVTKKTSASKKTAKKKTTSSKKVPRKIVAKAKTRKVSKKPVAKRSAAKKTAAKKPVAKKTGDKRIATATPARKKASSKKAIGKKAARKPAAPVSKSVPKSKK